MDWPPLTTISIWSLYVFEVVAVGVAALVLIGSPRRRANQLLAGVLLLQAVNGGVIDQILGAGTVGSDRQVAYFYRTLQGVASYQAWIVLYLAFAGIAIASPLTAPLRARWGQRILLALAAAAFVIPFWVPSLFLDGPGTLVNGTWSWNPNPVAGPVQLFFVLPVYGLTLAAAMDAVRRTPAGSAARAYAKAYLTGFGLNDVGWLLGGAYALAGAALGLAPLQWGFPVPDFLILLSNLLIAVGLVIVGVALVRRQLFDFDIRVKWTLRRGTVATAFLALFFIASQLIQNVSSQQLGYLGGAIAAGLLLFALRPLERAADRLAQAAMPQTNDTPQYRTFRKIEVYKAAVESAYETGAVGPRERASLEALRKKLGILGPDAAAIEADLVVSAAPVNFR